MAWLADNCEQMTADLQSALDAADAQHDPCQHGEIAFWLWRAGVTQLMKQEIAEPYALQSPATGARPLICGKKSAARMSKQWRLSTAMKRRNSKHSPSSKTRRESGRGKTTPHLARNRGARYSSWSKTQHAGKSGRTNSPSDGSAFVPERRLHEH